MRPVTAGHADVLGAIEDGVGGTLSPELGIWGIAARNCVRLFRFTSSHPLLAALRPSLFHAT